MRLRIAGAVVVELDALLAQNPAGVLAPALELARDGLHVAELLVQADDALRVFGSARLGRVIDDASLHGRCAVYGPEIPARFRTDRAEGVRDECGGGAGRRSVSRLRAVSCQLLDTPLRRGEDVRTVPKSSPSLARALLALARPLLDRLPAQASVDDKVEVVTVAHLAWNAVLFDHSVGSGKHVDEATKLIGSTLRRSERDRMRALFTELVELRRAQRPLDPRAIEDLEFIEDEHGELGVGATELLAPPRAPRKRTPKPRVPGPATLPPGTDHETHALFQSAKRFFALAPWRWMQNQDVLGVLDPVTGETNWCCVMGAGGEMFGLALYLGNEGYDGIRRAASGEALDDEALFGQAALVLAFLDRADLSKADAALVRSSGVAFRGAGAWPQIESHGLHRLPRLPTLDEQRVMRVALEQLIEVAPRFRRDPRLVEPDRDGRLLLRIPPAGSGEPGWKDARRARPPAIVRAIPDFDRVRAERAWLSLPRIETEVECDLFPMQAIIEEPGTPAYAPAAFMAVATAGGMVLRMDMTEPAGREAWAQVQFLELVEQLGGRPKVVYLMRPSLERVLQPLAEALDIGIKRVESLPELEIAKGFMERATSRS